MKERDSSNVNMKHKISDRIQGRELKIPVIYAHLSGHIEEDMEDNKRAWKLRKKVRIMSKLFVVVVIV